MTLLAALMLAGCESRSKVPPHNLDEQGGRTATVEDEHGPPPANVGERRVLRAFADLIAKYPEAPRYTVSWTAPGTKVGGVKPKVTLFEPKQRLLRDALEITGDTALLIRNVKATDIAAVAKVSGDFVTLQRRSARVKK